MTRHRGPVLVDTNAILESFRIGSWRALAGGYPLETVEACVIETQTGFQRRRPEQQIDEGELKKSLKAVHGVTDRELAVVAVRAPDIALDLGERSLWAHALTRNDAWVLCGPDKASLRFGVQLGLRDRLVALERLLSDAGYQPRMPLRRQYTDDWLKTVVAELYLFDSKRTWD